jgi:hypothetical protein
LLPSVCDAEFRIKVTLTSIIWCPFDPEFVNEVASPWYEFEIVTADKSFSELAAVKTQRPIISVPADDEHRVLPFRPRSQVPVTGVRRNANEMVRKLEVANDLSRYDRNPEEPDDFRHRMLANVAAFAFTMALLAIGIWLAMSIAHLRRTQDCVLMGRHDCVQITPGQT